MQIPDEDRSTLLSWSRSTSIRAGLVSRARIVLAAGDGLGTSAISQSVGVSRPTVIQWRERYAVEGLAGQVRDVIGLYLNPPAKAVVLRVDILAFLDKP